MPIDVSGAKDSLVKRAESPKSWFLDYAIAVTAETVDSLTWHFIGRFRAICSVIQPFINPVVGMVR